MDLRATFEHYYPEGSIGPGVSSLKGQCAVFAQSLVVMPRVGDTIETKKTACRVFGRLRKDIKEFLPGDVLVLDVGTKAGHIAVVSSTDQKRLNLSESNWQSDLRVHHNRWIIASSPQIYGIFRGKLKVAVIGQESPLQTTFIGITVAANKIKWDYKSALPKISEWFKSYSNGKLEVVFDSTETAFDSIPLSPFQSYLSVDINWYRQHITPLATGQATVLLLNGDQYINPYGTWGFMTYGDTASPVRMEVSCDDEPNFPEAPLLVHRIFHEICHMLYFLTGQPDRTHQYLLVENPWQNRSILLGEIDYKKLQEALVKIKKG